MAPDLAQQREEAHLLLDTLPGEKLTAVYNLLEVLAEPLSHSLAAVPFDEEELTPETVAALQRAQELLNRGEGIPHEEILREFGLS